MGESAKLEMTPMIDVVFQLLIFFIVTLKQEDILAHLDVMRPSPSNSTITEEKPDTPLDITVHKHGFMLKGAPMQRAKLERKLARLAGYSKTQTVVIKCTVDSPHKNLIQVLDICSKVGLSNLSVLTL